MRALKKAREKGWTQRKVTPQMNQLNADTSQPQQHNPPMNDMRPLVAKRPNFHMANTPRNPCKIQYPTIKDQVASSKVARQSGGMRDNVDSRRFNDIRSKDEEGQGEQTNKVILPLVVCFVSLFC